MCRLSLPKAICVNRQETYFVRLGLIYHFKPYQQPDKLEIKAVTQFNLFLYYTLRACKQRC